MDEERRGKENGLYLPGIALVLAGLFGCLALVACGCGGGELQEFAWSGLEIFPLAFLATSHGEAPADPNSNGPPSSGSSLRSSSSTE